MVVKTPTWRFSESVRAAKDDGTPLFIDPSQKPGRGKRKLMECKASDGWIHETDKEGAVVSAFHKEHGRAERPEWPASILLGEGSYFRLTPAWCRRFAEACGATFDHEGACDNMGLLSALNAADDLGEAIAAVATSYAPKPKATPKQVTGGIAELRKALPGAVKLVKASEATATGTVRRR